MNIIKKYIVSLANIFDVNFFSKLFFVRVINIRAIRMLSEDKMSIVMPSKKL
ncbi:hypothetical protein X966_00360 [Borrelia parkeri HR1]|nr:hypothetical protein X966_00360 [Borrelia parkeri HR1]